MLEVQLRNLKSQAILVLKRKSTTNIKQIKSTINITLLNIVLNKDTNDKNFQSFFNTRCWSKSVSQGILLNQKGFTFANMNSIKFEGGISHGKDQSFSTMRKLILCIRSSKKHNHIIHPQHQILLSLPALHHLFPSSPPTTTVHHRTAK